MLFIILSLFFKEPALIAFVNAKSPCKQDCAITTIILFTAVNPVGEHKSPWNKSVIGNNCVVKLKRTEKNLKLPNLNNYKYLIFRE